MKILVDDAWLHAHIENDPDVEVEAGSPEILLAELCMHSHGHVGNPVPSEAPDIVVGAGKVIPLFERAIERDMHYAFGRYIHLHRRDRGLTLAQLAERVGVDEEELRTVERDPHYRPRPRTVYQLANYFGDDQKTLAKLAGVVRTPDPMLEEAALRFAAMSDDLSRLDKGERALLNEFIKLLKD